jgi:hypothetical protein
MIDSKGETVGAGRRVVVELRTGGRLGFFATGGRLVERARLGDASRLLEERDEVDRDDDDVPCERVPRCEPSEPLMVIQPRRLSCGRIHQAAIPYEQRHQSPLCR